jgi:hypothetical protein
MLGDGNWLDRDIPAWPLKDSVRAGTMLGELERVGQLHRLKPWFEGVSNSPPFTDSPAARRWFDYRLNLNSYPASRFAAAGPQAFLRFETPRRP